jgi:hypothetical protein
MTLNNARRSRRRPTNHQTNGTIPEEAAAAAATAVIPNEQTDTAMTNEERLAQLKEQVCLDFIIFETICFFE